MIVWHSGTQLYCVYNDSMALGYIVYKEKPFYLYNNKNHYHFRVVYMYVDIFNVNAHKILASIIQVLDEVVM